MTFPAPLHGARLLLAALALLLARPAAAQVPDSSGAAAAPRRGSDDLFMLRSPGGASVVRLRGGVQTDARTFPGDAPDHEFDALRFRRARADVVGTFERVLDFRVQAEFATTPVQVIDAYLDAHLGHGVGLRAGEMKVPVGLERLQSSYETTFAELGLPSALLPNYDVGAMLHGSVGGDRMSWAAGVFTGTPDGKAAIGHRDNADVAARIFAHPFPAGALRGFGIGVAGTTGSPRGTADDPLLGKPTTTGGTPILVYRTDASGTAVASGRRTRLSPQADFRWRGLALQGEYAISSTAVSAGAEEARLLNTAWQATASLVLTGEAASYGMVRPAHPFEPWHGRWGAWEIAARVEGFDADEATFPRFAAPSQGSAGATQWTGGVNGYLNSHLRLLANYVRTDFHAPPLAAGRAAETLLVARLQVTF
jgi:phosphate-selective porin OprO/OprP